MLDYISYHAQRTPRKTAFMREGVEQSYADVERDLLQIISLLETAEHKPGQLVAVSSSDPVLHLLMLLALEHLGVTTLPFVEPVEAGLSESLASCDFVYAAAPIMGVLPERQAILDDSWVAQVHGRPVAPRKSPLPRSDSDPIYLLASSGSTGASKLMMLTRKVLERRVMDRIWQYGMSSRTRFMIAMPFTVGLIYSTARATLACGATILFPSRARSETETLMSATLVIVLPVHLRSILDLNPNRPPADNLLVVSTGASLSATLRARSLKHLSSRIYDGFGTNEVGPVGVVAAQHGLYIVLPGVKVEIVDEEDHVLPLGTVGRIRLKSQSMVAGYWKLSRASTSFRDGWFYCGDLGVLSSSDSLRILGRNDAMINIGGIKVSAEEVEESLAARVVGSDVGVCVVPDAEGIDQIYVAVAGATEYDQVLIDSVRAVLFDRFGAVVVLRLSEIPRGAAGKLRRAELQAAVHEAIRQAGGGDALSAGMGI